MAKKNDLALGGLESLMGSFASKKATVEPAAEELGNKEEAVEVVDAGGDADASREARRRGRPKGSGKGEERRAVSCKMLELHYQKLGRMAELAGCSRQDLMDVAYERLIASFESENGAVQVDSEKPFGKFNVKF